MTDSTPDFLSPIAGPELFFGLVAPIGTDLRLVSKKLSEELQKVGYQSVEIHVLAKAASLRSADLSRQVGAAITSPAGEVISLGCNEVPKMGGGAYWEGDEGDARDFQMGYDSGAKWKFNVFRDTLRRMKGMGLLKEGSETEDINTLAKNLIYSDDENLIKDAQILDVIEYGRPVHAEMMAISDAARLGRPLQGAVLYTTTFPCHICARHIVAAGISKVVYLEPYAKSIASELSADSVDAEPVAGSDTHRILFAPFVGIAPARFPAIFEKRGKRKDKTGKAIKWDPKHSEPIINIYKPTYIELESGVLASLYIKMKMVGMELSPEGGETNPSPAKASET